MRGRVFSCHHKDPPRILSTSVFQTLVTGVASDAATGLWGDLDGENIARDLRFSEMCQQYHVWKIRAAAYDYVGFEHYRRVLFFNPLAFPQLQLFDRELAEFARITEVALGSIGHVVEPRVFDRYLDLRIICDREMEHHLSHLMTRHDVLAQRFRQFSMRKHWKQCHQPEQWDVFVEALRQSRLLHGCWNMVEPDLHSVRFCNLYVMRTECFVEYMEFWWDCISFIRERISETPRDLVYFSERLANVYLFAKALLKPGFVVGGLPMLARN